MEAQQEHVCACSVCDPELKLNGPRIGPHHISVRFYDDEITRDGDPFRKLAHVVVDGKRIQVPYEAILGENGSVWYWRTRETIINGVPLMRTHHCRTCTSQHPDSLIGGICSARIDGHVELVKEESTLTI